MYACIYTHEYKEIYHKDLFHIIVEAVKYNLQNRPVSYRPSVQSKVPVIRPSKRKRKIWAGRWQNRPTLSSPLPMDKTR